MKYILSILIILSSLTVIGQGTPTYQGNSTSITYNRGTVGALRMQLLPRGFYPFPTFDTLGTIWVDSANTRGLYYHNGTSRIRMASIPYVDSVALSIEAGSVDSSIYTTVTRLADSLHGLRDYVDSNNTIIYSNIATLQSDVVTLDSALGVAFGAISNLYDTLPNYVDTAMLNDSLQAIKARDVPYVGAIADLNLGGNNILPNSVRLSTSPTGTLTNVGQIYWDATNVTPSIPLNANVTLQMGQEMYIRARNNTGVQINDGQVVYVNDVQGNNPTIALANSDSVNTSIVVGVATENIADNATGFVTTFGVVNGFNTSGFNDGDALYLNTVSGQLSNTIPAPPHNVVKVAIALNSTVNGRIFVHPSEPLGQDTTFAAPYNSDKVAPTQRSIGTYTRKIVRDSASALRTAINTKYGTNDTGRAATNIVTGGSLNKVRDSLNTLIVAKGSGTVTSIQLVGGTNVTITPTTAITTSGVYTISATGGGGTPTTSVNYKVLYRSGDSIKAASKVNIDTTDGRLVLEQNNDTARVNAFYGGGIKIVGTNRMGMSAVRIVDTVSIPAALQRAINAQITSTVIAFNAANPPTSFSYTGNYTYPGMMTFAGTGTYSCVATAYNSTMQYLNYNFGRLTSGTGANASAVLRTGSNTQTAGLICGNTKFSGGGGRGTFNFCLPTYNIAERLFVGYRTTTSEITTDPSSLTSTPFLALAKDAADTTLQFMHSSGGGSVTKVNTGITANNEDLYRLTVYIAPNSKFYMQLEVLSKTGTQVVVINPTTNVPAVSSKLVQYQGVNNAAIGSAISYGIIQSTEEVY